MNDFTTVFVFTDKVEEKLSSPWGVDDGSNFMLFQLVLFFIFCLFKILIQIKNKEPVKFIGVLPILVCFIIGVYVYIPLRNDDYSRYNKEYLRLLDIYKNQRYKISEGLVQVERLGHSVDEFVIIEGSKFHITNNSNSLGYDKTVFRGGILQEGEYVRVYSINNIILRIDLTASNPKVETILRDQEKHKNAPKHNQLLDLFYKFPFKFLIPMGLAVLTCNCLAHMLVLFHYRRLGKPFDRASPFPFKTFNRIEWLALVSLIPLILIFWGIFDSFIVDLH